MKIAIIGAGIAGSSATRIARALGHTAVLIDPKPENNASNCALATIRPQWFEKTDRGSLQQSWEWYEKWGAAVTQHATVTNWRNPNPGVQRDWWLVDPNKCLLEPDYKHAVAAIEGTNVRLDSGTLIHVDAVLNATGAYGGPLALPHEQLWGATLISNNAVLDYGPLRIHHLRPYHTLTVSDNNGEIRLGSSVAKTQNAAITEANEMLTAAEQAGIVQPGANWTVKTGIRARVKGNHPTLPTPGDRVATIGNLARSGYAMAPAITHNWLLTL